MTKDDLLSEEVVGEVFEIDDEVARGVMLARMQDRAKTLKCAPEYKQIVKSFQAVLDAALRAQRVEQAHKSLDGVTSFTGLTKQLRCGQWIASDHGIVIKNLNPFYPDRLACYHPIVPTERMRNLQTGEEQIKLIYKRPSENSWNTITVPKNVVASQQRIVDLANYGIAVTTENARWLVAYLADVENLNEDSIPLIYSSSKLGWIQHGNKEYFLPYRSDGIEFDGNIRFRQVFGAIQEHGEYDTWMRHIKQLRASGRLEIRLMMAASLASVLIKPCGLLPFIVDLWGDTEGGKTVTLMVAASIWADPANNAYIGDYKTTDTALEAKADMLNTFPLILDDTSKVSRRIKDGFEGLIYDLCSGKGKSRSNKALGINRENSWSCSILTCGEKPLQDYADQGGAINRIIEAQCGDYLYKDPHETAELVKSHYGFLGRRFVEKVADMDLAEIEAERDRIYRQISTTNKMQKQAYSMSVILLADKLAERWFFRDGIVITPAEAVQLMTDRDDVSDNQRAYEFIMNKIEMNPARFDPVTDKAVEQWGFLSDQYVCFYPSALEAMLRDEGYGLKPLLAWMNKRGLLDKDNDEKHLSKQVKVKGRKTRVYRIKLAEAKDSFEAGSAQLPDDFYDQAELDLSGKVPSTH